MMYPNHYEHDRPMTRREITLLDGEIEGLRNLASVQCRLDYRKICFPEKTWHPRVIRNMFKYWKEQVDYAFDPSWTATKDCDIEAAFKRQKNNIGCYCKPPPYNARS